MIYISNRASGGEGRNDSAKLIWHFYCSNEVTQLNHATQLNILGE